MFFPGPVVCIASFARSQRTPYPSPAARLLFIVMFALRVVLLQEHDTLMVGYIHDVRIISTITAVFLLAIAMMSLACVIRVRDV